MYVRNLTGLVAAFGCALALIAPAFADDQPAHPVWVDPLFGGIMFSGHVEAGVSYNPSDPSSNLNDGQLFTDRDDSIRMNQAMLNIEHDLDPNNPGWQGGFKFTGLYGTDARFTHFFNEFDLVTNSPYQWDIIEADAQLHSPLTGTGGIDWKIGQFPTPMGYESIDATANPLYSHSYIFSFGLPFKATGIYSTFHANNTLDVWAGWDTGVNASLGSNHGMVNSSLGHFLMGFGLNNLLDGKLNVLALAHVGPELPSVAFAGANGHWREYYDTVITYKINDDWTSVTELNLVHDDLFRATGGGAAQYITWKINDQWSVTGRAEAFADQFTNRISCYGSSPSSGCAFSFASAYPESQDYVDLERFYTGNSYGTGEGNTLYGEMTVGATYTPPLKLPGTVGLAVRPEVRWDTVLGGTAGIAPFAGTSNEFTLALDTILSF